MQFVVQQWNQPYCGHTVLTDINSNRSAAPADLVGNNGFVSCFQMIDKIHDGYSKAHERGFQFTPGHACASCADKYYCILKQFAIFLKLAAMRQVKKWSMRPAQCEVKCASHFRRNFTAQQFYNAKHFLLCRKAHLTQKKHSFIRQTKECFSWHARWDSNPWPSESESDTLSGWATGTYHQNYNTKARIWQPWCTHLIFYVCKSK